MRCCEADAAGEKSLQSNISHSASTRRQQSLPHTPCQAEAITSLLPPSPGNMMAANGGRMVAQYLLLRVLEGTWCSKKETAQADAIQWAKPKNPQGFCRAKKSNNQIIGGDEENQRTQCQRYTWKWGALQNPRQSSSQQSWSKFCSSPSALWAYAGENQSRIRHKNTERETKSRSSWEKKDRMPSQERDAEWKSWTEPEMKYSWYQQVQHHCSAAHHLSQLGRRWHVHLEVTFQQARAPRHPHCRGSASLQCI